MPMEKINRIIAFVIFIFTTIIYTMTVASTVSFWDCGEFIACSFKMAVPHPPGAPLYLLVGRVFSLLPIGDVAFRVNLISVFSSSITVMLLYLTIVHLVRQWKGKLEDQGDWLTAIFSAVVGSLTFAFTHSFWFNSAEAEVYAASMLFTALIVWLIMVWATKADEPGNEKYLLMIVYIIGLAIAVHLLNVLAIPFVAMIYYYKRYDFNLKSFLIMTVVTLIIMLVIYPGMVKYMPRIALNFGAAGLALVFIAIIAATLWAINNRRHILTLIFSSLLLITIGYSSYATIFIRSNLNPNIDENNPETIENFIKYIEREQYGEHSILAREGVWKSSPNARKYTSTSDFFWNYQIKDMYVRYFLWQFVGLDQDETSVSMKQFWALPLLLGLIGIYWHFRRDPKHALAVFALFFMTGLAIILYLNQPDPQPRERDYSYVGSFFAFAIWIGLGYAGLIDLIKEWLAKKKETIKPSIMYAVFVLLFVAVPLHMLAKNYHSHDRKGNYIAWDYSYNMLMSCEPNAILFTNGDNDTFPLWYLQEVEGVRTDVRIANLSLLNTDWYIQQLRDLPPTVPMQISDAFLREVQPMPWKQQTVSVKVPPPVAQETASELKKQFAFRDVALPDRIDFEVKPTMNSPYGGLIRTQDYMIMNIMTANRWKRPLYFAVTVPRSNMLSELNDYLRMDGLVLKIVPYKNWQIGTDQLRNNLIDVYQYRGLDDPNVYYDENIIGLLQNYRSGFIQLAEYYASINDFKNMKFILEEMDKKIDRKVIPWMNRNMRLVKDAFYALADSSYLTSILNNPEMNPDLEILGENLLRLRRPASAISLLEKAYELNPRGAKTLSLLLNAYEMTGNRAKSISVLETWMQVNPDDKNAQRYLESLKQQTKN